MHSFLRLIQQFWIDLQQGRLPDLGLWNYLLLALLIVWQGPIATLLGGAAAATGLLKPGLVFLVGVLGNLSADVLWYTLGRSGNFESIFEWRRLKVHRPRYEVLKLGMEANATKILLLAKLSFGLVIPSLFAAGVARVGWRKWFPVVFIGETIWTGTLVLLGFYASQAIRHIEKGLQLTLLVVLIAGLAILLRYVSRVVLGRNGVGLTSIDEHIKH